MREDLLTTVQAAKRLGMTPQWLARFCRLGALGRRVGRDYLITPAEIEAFRRRPRRGRGRPRGRKKGKT